MNISKVDPLPHQIEAVYGYVLRLPRIRFFIANDTGADYSAPVLVSDNAEIGNTALLLYNTPHNANSSHASSPGRGNHARG